MAGVTIFTNPPKRQPFVPSPAATTYEQVQAEAFAFYRQTARSMGVASRQAAAAAKRWDRARRGIVPKRKLPGWVMAGYPVSVGAYDGHIVSYHSDDDTVTVKFYDRPGDEYADVPRKKVKPRHPDPYARNPSRGQRSQGQVMSHRVYEIRYKHVEADERGRRNFKHTFRPGVCAEMLPDGSVRLYHKDGKPLMRDY